MQKKSKELVLISKKSEAENVTSLFFESTKKEKIKYISGQYLNLKLIPESVSIRGKSYTISSIPSDNTLCITIKRKGIFSSTIIDMPIGSKVAADGPYGNFYPNKDDHDIVMLAGGIGVTPFFSIIKDRLNSGFKDKITLFYSNKTLDQVAFFKDLIILEKNNSNFKTIYNLTEQKKRHSLVKEYERISEKMIKKYIASLDKKCYYICGSIGYVDSVWKILKTVGVKEECIFTESFF